MPAAAPSCRPPGRAEALDRLREQLLISQKKKPAVGVVRTAWPEIDESLPDGGLARGAVHEWIGTLDSESDRRRAWRPPLGLMIHLVQQVHAATDAGRIVWIGPAVWPYCLALCGQDASLLDRSLFIRARNAAERLPAAVLVLRSRAVTAVIVDGSGFNVTTTRRLQLAAEAGTALCLVARPPWERECLSAARTRWLVRSSPSPGQTQRWIVELLRCKGLQPICSEAPPRWSLERDHATRNVVMASDLGDGCRSTPTATGGQRAGQGVEQRTEQRVGQRTG